jgi:hypothetical protein
VGSNFYVLRLIFPSKKMQTFNREASSSCDYIHVRNVISKFRSELCSEWETDGTGPAFISVADF